MPQLSLRRADADWVLELRSRRGAVRAHGPLRFIAATLWNHRRLLIGLR
jgi:hypothetical protein